MRRLSAHYIYSENKLHRRAVIEVVNDAYRLFPLTDEIAFTEFYNGLIFTYKSINKEENPEEELKRFFQRESDILRVLSKISLPESSQNPQPVYFLLLEEIDLPELKWLPGSRIKYLHETKII